MNHHWTISTSSGRRVSLLCEEEVASDYAYSYASSSSPTPPLSPDYYHRPYTIRHDSIESASSSSSSLGSTLYSPRTPPNLSLPPLDKLLPVAGGSYFPTISTPSQASSPISSPAITTASAVSAAAVPEELSPMSPLAPLSSAPPSPKSARAAANPSLKRTSRRYTCHCGKSFTTSGHLARHTRIHTGEKNYICPEAGCGARFSRQDNCMQHYRTHQSGSASKRAARKRRMSAESGEVVVNKPDMHPRMHSYHAPQPVPYSLYSESSDGRLTALANAATVISGYP
ncbi:hypothetical protein L873DRAFT_920668 [Choiromyces venosus 120613-1]|uniref:C2H2 type master regulator of conidiophore development brlA n=1 Tax=Choiromyces venosus 120613-1 TaxID=1336337 RepID=A0A3N4JM78_9PEZI|nr:hypothetical protein L873DRAFT_920668 [Choiromyces venosus 120613-1]